MNRVDRLSAILTHLQSKKIVTAAEIAERFEISIRTVYRDINALIEGGVPIGAEAGVGYFLEEGYKLPPVMFTTEEASSLLIAGKLIENFPDKITQKHFDDALFKIKSVLKFHQKEHLETLSDNIRIYQYDKNKEVKDYPFLHQLQIAVVEKNVLQIVYIAGSSNEQTIRLIEPIGICYYSRDWHLIAWCRLRNEYRDFRIDRMKSVTTMNEPFSISKHINIDEYFKTYMQNQQLIEIIIEVENDILPKIDGAKYWFGFVSEEKKESTSLMTFYNNDLYYIAPWLLSFGGKIKIISPNTLVEIHLQMIKELYNSFIR